MMVSEKIYIGQRAFLISSGVLLISVLIELLLILKVNNGHFTYIMDDPMIHMALSENLLQGHYGVNMGEYSAPSSSILWPLLLIPFTIFKNGHFGPLILNIISSIGILWISSKILTSILNDSKIKPEKVLFTTSFFLILTIPLSNILGLIYIGMEHTLQVFIAICALLGIINHIKSKEIPLWFSMAIILGPLIRYENLSVSFAAIFYLFFVGERRISIMLGSIIVLFLGSFSFFLMDIGLDPLPTSVKAKSRIISGSNGGFIESALRNGEGSFTSDRGIILSTCVLFLMYYALFKEKKYDERIFALGMSFAVLLQMFFGQYERNNRYDVYIILTAVLSILFINRYTLTSIIYNRNLYLIVFSCFFIIITSYCSIKRIIKIPIASNNIYEQHYQMHRFATDFYKNPIAINDLGYVSYQNDNYVLDFAGLANIDALNYRLVDASTEKWMQKLAKSKNVRFAMIYDFWFKNVPEKWVKVAELFLSRKAITPASGKVSFYALDKETATQVASQLENYKKSLPEGVKFIIY